MKAFMQRLCGGASLVLRWDIYQLRASKEEAASMTGGNFRCFYVTIHNHPIKLNKERGKSQRKSKREQCWALTSGTGTAWGGATSEWLWGAGFLSGDRPRPPATPRCQPLASGQAVVHLPTFALVSQSLGRKDGMTIKRNQLPRYFSLVWWITCLEPSSVASCNGELVAPLRIAHVWHESVVERITWQEDVLINSNGKENVWRAGQKIHFKKTALIPHQESQNQPISVESRWSYGRLGGNQHCSTWWLHHSLPLCSSGSQI